ncbi:HSP20-like chaperone [Mrakia frigida]|uniref:p23/wos2 family protein n=1 Tax=Mrakia frigida TaxID=29902 RepID=UPI003FCBF7C8
MATEQTHNAEILWAQRSNEFDDEKNIIYFTVNLPNIIGEPELKVTDDEITFKAQAGSNAPGLPTPKTYAFTLPLYAPIVADLTKKSLTTRHLQLILRKKDAQEAFWPRITKEKGRNQWIKTDFAKVSRE